MIRFGRGRAALNNNYLQPNPDKLIFYFMVRLPLFQFIHKYIACLPTRQASSKTDILVAFCHSIGFFRLFDNSKGCS